MRYVAVTAVILAICATVWITIRGWRFETTDNAQVDGHIHILSSEVKGIVEKLVVRENQTVTKGQILIRLAAEPYEIAVQQAEAKLFEADSILKVSVSEFDLTSKRTKADLAEAEARVVRSAFALQEAQLSLDQAKAELGIYEGRRREALAKIEITSNQLTRSKELFESGLLSKEDLEQTEHKAGRAVHRLASSESTIRSQNAKLKVAAKNLDIRTALLDESKALLARSKTVAEQLELQQSHIAAAKAVYSLRRADLAEARLNLARTKVSAPVAGIVSHVAAEIGQVAQPSEPLLTVVSVDDLWVTANYKETQVRQMRPGQLANIRVDAYPNINFTGHVESISPATGARFSVLPPENASGNFVKVVQRVPVVIRFDGPVDQLLRLRPGLSVVPRVKLD